MIYRFTGPPENWLTATHRKAWAFNEGNKGLWSRLEPGDVAIFHSTGSSTIAGIRPKSSIIGIGYIGDGMFRKNDYWWIQEKQDEENTWPYVIPFSEMYFFSDTSSIDFSEDIAHKSPAIIFSDVQTLLGQAISSSDLIAKAKTIDPNVPNFPFTGSASKVDGIYESLVLDNADIFHSPTIEQDSHEIEERLAQSIDEKIASMTDNEVIVEASAYNPPKENYSESIGNKKVRKENQKQKRLVAKLYNYTCQVCGFRAEYTRKNGKPGYIIDVDHIIEKSSGGNERISNLWVLCPNCHRKKTAGIIAISVGDQVVAEGNRTIEITDKHLFSTLDSCNAK